MTPCVPHSTNLQQIAIWRRIAAAALFALTGLSLIFLNKAILSTNDFPSSHFLGLCQACCITITLLLLRAIRIVQFARPSAAMLPLALLYAANLVTSLAATRRLDVPSFSALARLCLPITLTLEYYTLNAAATGKTIMAIIVIVIGAVMAAAGAARLAVDRAAMTDALWLMAIYDVCVALEGVCLKKCLNDRNLQPHGILCYSALFAIGPLIALIALSGQFEQVLHYRQWNDLSFVVTFIAACLVGSLNLYAWILCTDYNSAVSAQVVSSCRSAAQIYFGMLRDEYRYGAMSFAGLNLTVIGGVFYAIAGYLNHRQRNHHVNRDKCDDYGAIS